MYFYYCAKVEYTHEFADNVMLFGVGDALQMYGHRVDLATVPTLTKADHDRLKLAICGPPRPKQNVKKFPVAGSIGKSSRSSTASAEPMFLDARGNTPTPNLNNAVTLIESVPELQGCIWYDSFLNRLLTGDPAREWKDTDDLEIALHIQRKCGVDKMGPETVSKALMLVAQRNAKNCVTEWLDSLVWDETERIADCLSDFFGAENTEHVRAASANFWVSIAARAYRPGCQVDNMLVLEGRQGIGKSRALRAIGGDWYSEQHESATNPKSFAEILQGKLLIEIGEMDAFHRSEVTRVKQVVSCTSDRYRQAYGRHAADHPRQCVFVGTTNRDDWNKDDTGARRFWPIRCSDVDIAGLIAQREQLFAEAVSKYGAGTTWWIMPAKTEDEQELRFEEDVWQEIIAEWLALRQEVTIQEIMVQCLKFDTDKMPRAEQMRIGSCLRRIGWAKQIIWSGNKTRRVWKPE